MPAYPAGGGGNTQGRGAYYAPLDVYEKPGGLASPRCGGPAGSGIRLNKANRQGDRMARYVPKGIVGAFAGEYFCALKKCNASDDSFVFR